MSCSNAIRIAAIALTAAGTPGSATGIAAAWPMPITPEQQSFITQARNAGYPGSDDEILTAGLYGYRLLMTGNGTQGVTDTIAAQNGVDPAQAGALVRVAHGILCTSARG